MLRAATAATTSARPHDRAAFTRAKWALADRRPASVRRSLGEVPGPQRRAPDQPEGQLLHWQNGCSTSYKEARQHHRGRHPRDLVRHQNKAGNVIGVKTLRREQPALKPFRAGILRPRLGRLTATRPWCPEQAERALCNLPTGNRRRLQDGPRDQADKISMDCITIYPNGIGAGQPLDGRDRLLDLAVLASVICVNSDGRRFISKRTAL